MRHDGDVVGDAEHHFHVVLDDDDVDRARQFADFRNCALGFGRAHAAGRLIEQQQLRLGDQRHADLEQRHIAIRQRAGLPVRKRRQPDLLERPLDPLACGADRSRRRGTDAESVSIACARDPEILGDGELGEDALDLQRAFDAEPADLVRPAGR